MRVAAIPCFGAVVTAYNLAAIVAQKVKMVINWDFP